MPERRQGQRRLRRAPVTGERRGPDRRRSGERRQTVRLRAEIWTEEVSGKDTYFRRTGDIGAGGAFFDRAIPRPVGTALTLRLSLPGDDTPISVQAEVVSIAADGFGMGIKFRSFAADGSRRLKQFLVATLAAS
jgi:hypothetical protein